MNERGAFGLQHSGISGLGAWSVLKCIGACLQTLQGELRAAKQELEARGSRLAKLEQQVTELQHAQQTATESGARMSHELEAARSVMEQLTAANRKLTGDSERGAKAAVELVQAEAALHLERDERERLVAQHRSRLNKFGMQAGSGRCESGLAQNLLLDNLEMRSCCRVVEACRQSASGHMGEAAMQPAAPGSQCHCQSWSSSPCGCRPQGSLRQQQVLLCPC